MPTPRRRPIVPLLLGLLLVLLAMGVLLTRSREQEPATVDEPVAATPPATRQAAPPRPAPPVPVRVDAGPRPKPLEYMADGIPIMPAGPNDPHPEGPAHPHPITPEHRRLYRETAFLSGLNDAMDAGDAPALRRLLSEYKAEYPQDDQKLQSGYELVADCLEHPGAETRVRAQHYWETERASTLRRYVRRLCIEGQP